VLQLDNHLYVEWMDKMWESQFVEIADVLVSTFVHRLVKIVSIKLWKLFQLIGL